MQSPGCTHGSPQLRPKRHRPSELNKPSRRNSSPCTCRRGCRCQNLFSTSINARAKCLVSDFQPRSGLTFVKTLAAAVRTASPAAPPSPRQRCGELGALRGFLASHTDEVRLTLMGRGPHVGASCLGGCQCPWREQPVVPCLQGAAPRGAPCVPRGTVRCRWQHGELTHTAHTDGSHVDS